MSPASQTILPRITARRGFRQDIQGLRALAVILVIGDHILGWPHGGYIGVDVFFVISGYLITGLLLREHTRNGKIDLREFYARRVRRLMPMSILVLVTTALLARYLTNPARAKGTLVDAAWAAGLMANVRYSLTGTDYFAKGQTVPLLQHYWSLAVEEQYYLVWPFVILIVVASVGRLVGPARAILAVGVVLGSASMAWAVYLVQVEPVRAYFSTPARAWELGVGAVLAVATRNRVVPRRMQQIFGWLGLLGLIACAVLIPPGAAFPGPVALAPVLCSAALLLGGPALGPLLSNRVAEYTGEISYSLYLWHFPIGGLIATLLPGRWSPWIAVAVSFALSALSFHMVEDPIRSSKWLSAKRRRPRHRRPSITLPMIRLATVLAPVALLAYLLAPAVPPQPQAAGPPPPASDDGGLRLERAVQQSVGVPAWGPLSPSMDQLVDNGAPEWFQDKCLNVDSEADVDRCTYGSPTATKRLVVMGDSVAISWMPGLRANQPPDWRITLLTRAECPNTSAPLDPKLSFDGNNAKARCAAHLEWSEQQIERLKPDLVMLSDSHEGLIAVKAGSDTARVDAWRTGFDDVLRRIKPFTPRVVVVSSPPGARKLTECATAISRPSDCVGPVDPRWAAIDRVHQEVADKYDVPYLDVSPWFCFAGQCTPVIGDIIAYLDTIHLSRQYSEHLGPSVARFVWEGRPRQQQQTAPATPREESRPPVGG